MKRLVVFVGISLDNDVVIIILGGACRRCWSRDDRLQGRVSRMVTLFTRAIDMEEEIIRVIFFLIILVRVLRRNVECVAENVFFILVVAVMKILMCFIL